MNPYDQVKWGVHIPASDDIFPAESFKFANDFVSRFNMWIASDIYPKATENDAVMFVSLFIWDSNEHGEHCPEDIDWDNLM